jgi:putative transposase
MGIAPATFYKWKAIYGGLDVSDVQKLKTLEEEHYRLKRMSADLAMDNQLLRDLFSKKGWALPPNGK